MRSLKVFSYITPIARNFLLADHDHRGSDDPKAFKA